MQENNNKFSFTYSAPTEAERREIENIRRQYKVEEKAQGGVERLRTLHSKVVGTATAISLAFGVGGTLIFGGGMALVLEFDKLVVGIILSVIGAIPIALAYPMYKRVLDDGKRKYGDEILRLSEDLLKKE